MLAEQRDRVPGARDDHAEGEDPQLTRPRCLERNAPDPVKAALDSPSDEDLTLALAALRVAETREIAAISLAN